MPNQSGIDDLFLPGRPLDDAWHKKILEKYTLLPLAKEEAVSMPLFKAVVHVLENLAPEGWEGAIDGVDKDAVFGWAKRVGLSDSQFISLDVNFVPALEYFLANNMRPDVKAHGYGTGRYGFGAKINLSGSTDGFFVITLREPLSSKISLFRFFNYA